MALVKRSGGGVQFTSINKRLTLINRIIIYWTRIYDLLVQCAWNSEL